MSGKLVYAAHGKNNKVRLGLKVWTVESHCFLSGNSMGVMFRNINLASLFVAGVRT